MHIFSLFHAGSSLGPSSLLGNYLPPILFSFFGTVSPIPHSFASSSSFHAEVSHSPPPATWLLYPHFLDFSTTLPRTTGCFSSLSVAPQRRLWFALPPRTAPGCYALEILFIFLDPWFDVHWLFIISFPLWSGFDYNVYEVSFYP